MTLPKCLFKASSGLRRIRVASLLLLPEVEVLLSSRRGHSGAPPTHEQPRGVHLVVVVKAAATTSPAAAKCFSMRNFLVAHLTELAAASHLRRWLPRRSLTSMPMPDTGGHYESDPNLVQK